MKKRVLSLLLLLAMLVTMVPTMAVGAAAETSDEEVPKSETSVTKPISDYYSLYKTDGLVAFFDAFDPANGTLDLANGKWYARIYNAETKKFEKSETIYAEIKGGAYDAETNPTGWQTFTSGFGYVDPELSATENVIDFGTKLLQYVDGPAAQRYSNWAIETLVRVDLRDVAEKDGRVENAFLFGPVGTTHWTNLQTEDTDGGKGAVRWSLLPTDGSGASLIDMTVGSAKTSSGFVNYNGKAVPIVVRKSFVKKTADEESKYTVTHGNIVATGAANAEKTKYGDVGVQVLKNEQGVVYALRVYADEQSKGVDVLSDADAARNNAVDTLLRLKVDIDIFNAMTAYEGLVDKFFSFTVPSLDYDATKDDYERAIQELVAEEKAFESVRALSEYEKMYVGANGETTANGGKLVALFGSTADVDVESDDWDGTWVNKLGVVHAKFGNSDRWERRADGSIGFTGLYGQMVDGNLVKSSWEKPLATDNILMNYMSGKGLNDQSFANTRLDLGLSLLPKDDFTIEYVAKYNPIYVANPDGTVATDASGAPIEYYTANGNKGIANSEYTAALDHIGFISSWTVCRDGVHDKQMPARGDVIWMLTDATPSWSDKTVNWVGTAKGTNGGGMLASGIRDYGKVHTYAYTRDETLIESEGGRTVEAVYSVLRDTTACATSPKLSTANLGDKNKLGLEYFNKDDTGEFYLSSSLPTDFYAVRIYNTVLTTREMMHNAFVDIVAYAKADMSEYNTLDDETKALVEDVLVPLGFPGDNAEFAEMLAKTIELYANQKTAEDSLYVTDGLRVLTAAYTGFDTGAIGGDAGFSWFNAAKENEMISLRGTGWARRADQENGGYYIIKDYNQVVKNSDRNFGVYLTPDMLPDDEYSVELVVNPVGIVEFNEDGSYTRYVDSTTTYGIHYDNGIMIGPLRCLIFPSAFASGSQRAGLENRWCYDYGNRCWNQGNRNHIGTEKIWKETDIDDIITYNIDYDVDETQGDGNYGIYADLRRQLTLKVTADKLITNDAANNAFQLMVGMPCGVFSVRVYDRVLTEAEKIQNHAADIVYFYGLDTTLLKQVLPYFKDDPTLVYRGLADLGFDLSKEQAQAAFDARLSALWLGFESVAIRNDRTEGLRYYFDIDETNVAAMVHAGFTIEIGAIANIGQNAAPSLDGRNYDYKIVAYDGVGGRNAGFFIDDDTFAITVQAESANKTAMMTEINVLGFIRLVSKEGKEMVFYVAPTADAYSPSSFFRIYSYMQKNETVTTDSSLYEHLNATTENCYERDYIYLKADASAGGNGSKDAPYNNFATAFAAAKVKLPLVNVPTYVTILAADGVYELHELLSIDGSEIPYEFCRFLITSENGKSTLSSTKTLDNSGFVKSDNNIWVYQFAADANGDYPFFRYLYVNGKIADIAHNGANSFLVADEPRYMTAFYRWEVGPWKNALLMYQAGTLKPDTIFYVAEKVDLNTQFAYYRDLYLTYKEVLGLGSEASPVSYSTAKNATPFYYARFQELLFNMLIAEEINALYESDACGKDAKILVEKLPEYVSIYTADLLNAKPETIYTEAQVDEILAAYNAQLKKVSKELIETLKNDSQITVSGALKAYKPASPAYPTQTQVADGYEWADTPSTGIYAAVTALYERGVLTHASMPDASYNGLAQELQFLYYRDAYLALAEVEDLEKDEVLTLTATPKAADGSEQYKALFYRFLYQKLAVEELTAATAAAANKTPTGDFVSYNMAPIAVYETTRADANDAYKAVLTEIRNAQIIASGDINDFGNFGAYLPAVKEADAPYEGKVPFVPTMEQCKIYLNEDLVGNLAFAMEQGHAKLASTAEKIKREAAEKYLAAYNLFAEAQKTYEDLLAEGKSSEAAAYNTTRKDLLDSLKNAYSSYVADMALAERYLSDEYEENYILEGSGIELAFPTEWTYNLGQIIGVDYKDKIVAANGVSHVAIYMDPTHYKELSIHNESHFYNRMLTLQMSHAYLDKNGEYYYNAETGALYYYSENGIAGLNFEYPTMNNMIYVTNIKNMIVKDMAFTGLDYTVISDIGFVGSGSQAGYDKHANMVGETDYFPSGAPIYGKMIRGFEVIGCNFHDLGCEAISFRNRVENTTIKNSTFTDIGSSAIRFGGGTASTSVWSKTEGSENCIITNNYFDRIAQKIYCSPAVTIQYAKDIDLSYNTIRNTSYSGFSVGWSWGAANFMYGEGVRLMHVDIHHNYIESVMQQQGDGGHIYVLGGNAAKEEHTLFNWSHDNYLVFTNKTGDGEGRFHAGQYFDGSSSNWETYNTVVVARSFGASGLSEGWNGNAHLTVEETVDEAHYSTVDTEFSMEEYERRLKNDHNSSWPYFEQKEPSYALNITFRDCFLINARSEVTEGTARGSQHYEAFRNGAVEERFIYVENMTYVKDPARLPREAENIIYEAGCKGAKADPYDIADNNY